MKLPSNFAIILGAALVSALGFVASQQGAQAMADRLHDEAEAALAEAGTPQIDARFANRYGAPSRHPVLSGGETLDDPMRARAAQAVASISGVGGVSWVDGTVNAESGDRAFEPLHCQEDVDGLLRTRTIRFEEASTALVPASRMLLDEVANALKPCVGAIIAINGHTDKIGDETANVALSMDRARVVREALVRRGIPRDTLRARGLGSSEPVQGLTAEDPANRRIEFSVIRLEPLTPTPVDTPGPR
ncbi:OmpA family protein [Qipengyuania vesicularis]|uniref:OmpA family protein n=1 Tax=Qipengyuania vesicularis TaxID=2867232 RepID=UPI001C87ABF4|nr:OmpA family protein [Qipengyuania vesicularis]MBX7527402.1 OmpA family protein [Qipengyuania vesicularis]